MGIAYKNSLATQGVSSDIFFVSSTRITRWLGRHEVRIRRSVGSRTGPQVPVVIGSFFGSRGEEGCSWGTPRIPSREDWGILGKIGED